MHFIQWELPLELFLQFQHCHSVSLERPCYWAEGGVDPKAAFLKLRKEWNPDHEEAPGTQEPELDARDIFEQLQADWIPEDPEE